MNEADATAAPASAPAAASPALSPRDPKSVALAGGELRAAVEATAGTGSPAEQAAVLALAKHCVCAYSETEGLVLARRAMRLADAAGDAAAGAMAHNLLTAALEGLDEPDALDDECVRMEARAAAFPGRGRAWLMLAVCRRRAGIAVGRHEGEAAERHLADAAAAARTLGQADAIGDVLPLDLAEVRLAQGRPAEAARAIAAFAATLPNPVSADIRLMADSVRARASFLLGAPDARPLVESVLERLADVEAFAAGLRRTIAISMADDLERAAPKEPLVDRVFEVAARASVERALAIQSFLSTSGAAVPIEPDDLAILARARDRAVERSPRLVAAISRDLPSTPAEHRFVERRSGMRTRVVVCAWCGRLRVPGAAWVPIQQLVPIDGSTGWAVAHEVCEDCCNLTGPPPR